MKTMGLKKASKFLKLHPSTVLIRARKDEIPGAKLGKRWVFIDEDLIEFIRSKYYAGKNNEESKCYSSEEKIISGTTNLRSVDRLYTDLLEPATKKKQRK